MNFSDVLIFMKQNKLVRRKNWFVDGYVFLNILQKCFQYHSFDTKITRYYNITHDDILAEDWEVFEY